MNLFNSNAPIKQEMINDKSQIEKKKKLINDLLDDIVKQKMINHKLYTKYRKRHNFFSCCINTTNAVSVSSLISSLPTGNIIGLGIGAGCASLSSIGTAINTAQNNQDKFLSSRTTYCQLGDLERTIRSQLIRNHLTSSDCDNIIEELNHTLSLINDSSLT
jgi:hypothetical protein